MGTHVVWCRRTLDGYTRYADGYARYRDVDGCARYADDYARCADAVRMATHARSSCVNGYARCVGGHTRCVATRCVDGYARCVGGWLRATVRAHAPCDWIRVSQCTLGGLLRALRGQLTELRRLVETPVVWEANFGTISDGFSKILDVNLCYRLFGWRYLQAGSLRIFWFVAETFSTPRYILRTVRRRLCGNESHRKILWE